MKNRIARSHGYTLTEMLVAMCLAMIALTGAMPSMSDVAASVRVRSGTQAMSDTLLLARSEAVKRNGRVIVCKSSAGIACQSEGNWEQGWIVFQDVNNNGLFDPQEPFLHREHALGSGLSIRGNTPVRDYVSYTAYGKTKLVSGAFQAGTFTVCPSSSGHGRGRQVIINSAGRARTAPANAADCGNVI